MTLPDTSLDKPNPSSHTLLALIDTFSEDNNARGKQFEKLCKWILETHPQYRSKLETVWLWDDWPGRWGRDCGIDLIAQDTDGKIWAIQAKCYASHNSITKQDVDSFLSESSNEAIDQRLLIATTDKIGANAKGVIERQHTAKPVNQLMLAELLEAPLEWPSSLDQLSTAAVKKAYTPKPYQQIAIDKVVKDIDQRGQLIMACGTGKTLTGLWIAEELDSETTLVLLPSLLLLSKTLLEWLTHSKEDFAYLPVCSDETVAKSEDAISLSTSDLSFPSTTDADEIASFINSPGRKVIFSTYQSSPKIAAAFAKNDLKPFDLILADEAHRCAGKIGSDYSTVLENDQIPSVNRLFMTATPKVFATHSMKQAADSGVDVVSMDDEATFGKVLHTLSFGEAIEQKLLTDYQVVIVGIDSPSYESMITQRALVKTDTNIESDAQSLASHIGLAKAIKNYNLRRIISFHSRVKSSRDFAEDLPKVIEWMPESNRPDGELITSYVSGAMPTNQRNQSLQALGQINDNQRYVLGNARCLSEGVDVPTLDGIAFIDPRNSEIDIVQAVGRAIRLADDKETGTIVIPVFIPEHEDPDEVLSSSPFKKIWAVINALRSHDDALAIELDGFRKQLGKRGTTGRSAKIHFDLPTTVSADFERALDTKLIESTTASWEFWFGLLELYKEEHGDCLISQKHITASGHNLGRWVSKQRGKKDKLTPERIQRIDALGFAWEPHAEQWEQGMKELSTYKEGHGDCLLAAKYITGSGYKLGVWVSTQRSKKDKLTPEQVQRLEELGFIWDARAELWEQGIKELSIYKEEHGDCLPPAKYITASGHKLGSWANTQRSKKDQLTPEQVNRLDALGFVWELLAELWEQGFKELILYKEAHGDCSASAKHITASGHNLGSWINSQRTKKDQLTPERIQRLDALG
jgi:predicted helicase